MKKLIKNKYVLLIGSIIFLSILYFIVEKTIDNFSTEDNVAEVYDTNDFTTEVSETTVSLDDEFLNDEIIESNENIPDGSNNIIDGKTESSPKIYVYITGEVNNPGVVTLDVGSRIIDAINAAGGTTNNANITKVNLVYVLQDGMKVNIPNNDDLKNKSNFEYITINSGDGGSVLPETHYKNSSSDSRAKNSVVNINTATQTELETLPGIGPSIALNIINYRRDNGSFSSIEDIKSVSGIGDSKYEQIKNYISV